MKFLRNLLGIGTLEEKLEEVYLHCVRANAQTHSSLFQQKDMLQTLIDSEAKKPLTPQIWTQFEETAMPVEKQSPKIPTVKTSGYHGTAGCTLEKEYSQYREIINFLMTRKHATVNQIYGAVRSRIVTKNRHGKRAAVHSSLSRLEQFGFVKRIKRGVYQYTGGQQCLKNI